MWMVVHFVKIKNCLHSPTATSYVSCKLNETKKSLSLFFFVSIEISPFWYTRGWLQCFEVEKRVTTTTQFCRNEPNAPFYGFSSANNVCHKLWFEYNDIFRLLSRARAHKIKVDDFKSLAEEVERERERNELRQTARRRDNVDIWASNFRSLSSRGGISQPNAKTS